MNSRLSGLFDAVKHGFDWGETTGAITNDSAKAYVEKLFFDQTRIRSLPKLYILCTESSFAPVTALAKSKIDADRTNWTFVELKTSHVPQASDPDKLLQVLLELVQIPESSYHSY